MAEQLVREIMESRAYREDAAGNIEGTRVFFVSGYGDAVASTRAPGIPAQFEYWPGENHIIAHGHDARYVPRSNHAYHVTVTYKPVYFTAGDGLGVLAGFRARTAAVQQFEYIDLDGFEIGPCYNKGANVWRPQTEFELAVVLSKYEPLVVAATTGGVNAETFIGADPGLVMFMGADTVPVNGTRWNTVYRFMYHAVDVFWDPNNKVGAEKYYWSYENDPKTIIDPCAKYNPNAPCQPRIPYTTGGKPCSNRVQPRRSFLPLFQYAIQWGF